MKKVIIDVLILALMTGIIAGGMTVNNSRYIAQEEARLEEERKAMQEEYAFKKADYESLKKEKVELNNQIASLKEDISDLEDEKKEAIKKYNELAVKYNELGVETKKYKTFYQNIANEVIALQGYSNYGEINKKMQATTGSFTNIEVEND